ncbi:C4-dicarboxylate transporter DctA [Foetidibacter luteolus]|uniref:C4-dicarboxylate transporter DctA n=1 Tax=Foetidibacter luteolus TaxID=2608880 RepID=UPI00129B722D|nr:C4-dicarboxylate transporter DctA [Foetidibacter luteolus]
MKLLFKSLYLQVIIAIVTGILLGYFFPNIAVQLKPLGDGFIKLVKMLIGPVIFCTIVTGMGEMRDMKKMGRVGLKSILYFEVLTTLALIIGLVVVNIARPGEGMHINPATLDSSAMQQYAKPEAHTTIAEFLLNIIPDTLISAFVKGDLLQVLLVSVLFGFAVSKLGEKARPVVSGVKYFTNVLFTIVKIIMKAAPVGALGAMSFTIGKYGIKSLTSLGELMLCFYLTCLLFIFVVLGSVLKAVGFSIFKLLKFIKEELLIVLGTSSSESALPGIMEKLKKVGCSEPVVGLVVPAGYSFNLDGTSIYLTMAAVFIAQAIDVPLALPQQLTLLLVLLLTSKGAAGVTGSGFITLAVTLPVVGHIPAAAVALILGIDRFMSEARALTNIIGNTVATIVIARWEKELDADTAKKLIG